MDTELNRPSQNYWLTSSRLSFGISVLSLLAFLILITIPSDSIVRWAAMRYSPDGEISPGGWALLRATIVRARSAAVVALLVSLVGGLLLGAAERKMAPIDRRAFTTVPKLDFPTLFHGEMLAIVLFFSVVRLSIGVFHVRDSLWCDELYTVMHYGSGPFGSVFGVSGVQWPNNHILNSLLVRLSLAIGLRDELGYASSISPPQSSQ
jgi:hypothetical protein